MSPNELIEELINMFPGQDSLVQYLFFLLLVFFGLYILFQIIFWLGRDKKKKAKAEPAKKESPKPEPKPEAKPAPKPKETKETLVILEEPKPTPAKEEPNNPYYTHDRAGSYITSSANVEVKNYGYGDNYLYNYFQEVAPKPKVHNDLTIEDIEAKEEAKESKLERESDKVVATYNSLPDELKRYIIDKILSSSLK